MARIYDTKRWLKVRAIQLSREPLCRMCSQLGIVTAATDVDHITPIANGGEPFDYDNLRSLCHEDHSRVTAAAKNGTLLRGCDVNGVPLDPRHPWRVEIERKARR